MEPCSCPGCWGQEQGEASTSVGASDSHVETRAPSCSHVTESRLTLLAACQASDSTTRC